MMSVFACAAGLRPTSLLAMMAMLLMDVLGLLAAAVAGEGGGGVSDYEMNALEQLYNATRGDSWRWRSEYTSGARWNFTRDDLDNSFVHNPCSSASLSSYNSSSGGSNLTQWQGISCSGDAEHCNTTMCSITELSLSYYRLDGTLPDKLGDLTALEELFLRGNDITGTIPSALANLVSLKWFTVDLNRLSGTIPSEMGTMTALLRFDIEINHVTGSIPTSFGELLSLEFFDLGLNFLTGPFPSFVGSFSRLDALEFDFNYLTGSLPSDLGSLWGGMSHFDLSGNHIGGTIPETLGSQSSLTWFDLEMNMFTGSIPSAMGNLSALMFFDVGPNALTGSIPSEMGTLSLLEWFDVGDNRLTGPIPSSLGSLSLLEWLDIGPNQLTGSIPSTFGDLLGLEIMEISFNMLTGTIPSTLHSLSALVDLYMSHNDLTGPLPEAISSLFALRWLDTTSNHLTSTIPSSLSQLASLAFLDLSSNYLTHTVPSGLGNLTDLLVLAMETNILTGTIPPELGRLAAVEVLELSNNLLSGSIPFELGGLDQVRTLALSVNCLDSVIPLALCGLDNIEVIAMSGLGGAHDCDTYFTIPLFETVVLSGDKTEIPACIWTLPMLKTFHAVGNGITGSMGSLPPSSRMEDMMVSHNLLEGTLPDSVLDVMMLDVSYNRITGRVSGGERNRSRDSSSTLVAEVNLLSGQLPTNELEEISHLNLLNGNMFSCGHYPENDESGSNYACGSLMYDISMYFACGALFGLACLVLWLRRVHSNNKPELVAENITPLVGDTFGNILSLHANAKYHVRFLMLLVFAILTAALPLYVLRLLDHDYSTHWNVYSWVLSFAFMKGEVMGTLAVGVWGLGVFILLCYIVSFKYRGEAYLTSTTSSDVSSSSKGVVDKVVRLKAGLAFLCNVIVTGGVNVLYVLCITYKSLSPTGAFMLRLSMSVFRIVSVQAIPMLCKHEKDRVRNALLRFNLIIFNDMFIPCVVMALTSPHCFQELLVKPDAVNTEYSFLQCIRYYTTVTTDAFTVCSEYATVIRSTASFTPPYTYSYQCSSMLQEAYIPMMIIAYGLELLLHMSTVVMSRSVEYESIPLSIRSSVPGLLWPKYWHRKSQEELASEKSASLFNSAEVMCLDVLYPLAMILTFGLCSPVLAIMVALVGVVRVHEWTTAMHRFYIYDATSLSISQVKNATPRSTDDIDRISTKISPVASPCLKLLSSECFSMYEVLEKSFTVILVFSLVCIIFIYWDTSSSLGWEVPFAATLFACVLKAIHSVIGMQTSHMKREGERLTAINATFNPMSL